jgi:hypothetical protein
MTNIKRAAQPRARRSLARGAVSRAAQSRARRSHARGAVTRAAQFVILSLSKDG